MVEEEHGKPFVRVVHKVFKEHYLRQSTREDLATQININDHGQFLDLFANY